MLTILLFLSALQTGVGDSGQGPEEHVHVHDGYDAGDGDGLQTAPPRGIQLSVHQLQSERAKYHQGLGRGSNPEKYTPVSAEEKGEDGCQEEGGGEEKSLEEKGSRLQEYNFVYIQIT